jgi:serine/threonine protein phosphatase 1
MRTLVIGDIHGGFKGLEQALNRAKIDPDDQLIFLGDYVDGWSESAETVAFLIALSKENRCVFIRGNHDDLCFKWLAQGEKPTLWVQQGGQSTIESYNKLSRKDAESHIPFFENLVSYHIDKENRLFIHAGFQNLKGPLFEYYDTAAYWDRTLWEMALAVDKHLNPQDKYYPERLKIFKEIYLGHTPVTRIGKTVPVKAATVWNIDTGAAFKGPVTIMDIKTKEFWQSDPVWMLYPDERGRNAF